MVQAQNACNYLLNMISGRLGLDHDRVLGGRYAFPVMARYLVLKGGKIEKSWERHRLLYWYVHSFLWGRFAGSTETVLNQDLSVLEKDDEVLDRLIEQLQLSRGTLEVRPEDFAGWSLGARFYPMLYLLTRVTGALDWDSGVPLSAHLLGRLNSLQVHHIFPKKVLYNHGFEKPEVNAIANYCFLTQGANLAIKDKEPFVYFQEIERNHPGALASQWVPMDPELWKVENYREFLTARRCLLAEAANRFLEELYQGGGVGVSVSYPVDTLVAVNLPEEEIDEEVAKLLNWLAMNNVPMPQLNFELCNDEGEIITMVDLAWPEGVQSGYSQPVALALSGRADQVNALSQASYQVFTSLEGLQVYLRKLVGVEEEAV